MLNRIHRSAVGPLRSLIRLALGTCLLFSLARPAHAQWFASESLGLTSDGIETGYSGPGSDVNIQIGTPVPRNVSINKSNVYHGSGGDVTFGFNAAANYRGFWSTGTYASGNVANAYYNPAPAAGQKAPPQGFYVLGGMGSWTKHRFVSPESLFSPFANMTWHVSGSGTSDLGVANSRIDFAVTRNAPDWFSLFNMPGRLFEYGPGVYHYNTAVALDVPLDFLFWSSAYYEVTKGDIASLGGSHRRLSGTAAFMDTFYLDTIELFNGNGAPVSEWSLLDDATGQVIFNQSGRVASVPEPSAAVCGIAMISVVGSVAVRRMSARRDK
jgi:hypothetical protein